MKVNIDKTLEVSDGQRKQIASVLDQKVVKRDATRDEMKEFIWFHGSRWERDLTSQYAKLTGDADVEVEPEDDDEDLLGDVGDDELDIESLI